MTVKIMSYHILWTPKEKNTLKKASHGKYMKHMIYY